MYDQLHANADAGHESPEVQAEDIVLECHYDAGRGVPEQRVSEDGAAAEAIGEEADERGPDEQAGKHGRDEAGDASGLEESVGGGGEDAGSDQAGCDVAGEEQVVELEKAAERDEHDMGPGELPIELEACLHGNEIIAGAESPGYN